MPKTKLKVMRLCANCNDDCHSLAPLCDRCQIEVHRNISRMALEVQNGRREKLREKMDARREEAMQLGQIETRVQIPERAA